jgi:MarR family transcriptional regulator, transcriptional regulator for hemolysin
MSNVNAMIPIGLQLARTAKAATRAFDAALAQAGGSEPTWLILLSLVQGSHRTQAELAQAVGITGATLTHHLAGLERQGLVTRERVDDNRRVQRVALTEAGRRKFHELRERAMAHDARLRAGFTAEDLERLHDYLTRLAANVTGADRGITADAAARIEPGIGRPPLGSSGVTGSREGQA